jgi:hypothetical protein
VIGCRIVVWDDSTISRSSRAPSHATKDTACGAARTGGQIAAHSARHN